MAYPFILEVLNDWRENLIDEEEVSKMLQFIEVYVFRRFCCEVPTNALNKIFMTLAKEIKSKKGFEKQYFELLKHIINNKKGRARFPKDDEFKAKLSIASVYLWKITNRKYLFRKLENFSTRNVVNVDNETTIEHNA